MQEVYGLLKSYLMHIELARKNQPSPGTFTPTLAQ